MSNPNIAWDESGRAAPIVFQCRGCPQTLSVSGPDRDSQIIAAIDLGWRRRDGVQWCPDCWSGIAAELCNGYDHPANLIQQANDGEYSCLGCGVVLV